MREADRTADEIGYQRSIARSVFYPLPPALTVRGPLLPSQCSEDYVYHGTACPWLQVRILRLLQHFPIPATEAMRVRLNEVVGHILNKTEVTKVSGGVAAGGRTACWGGGQIFLPLTEGEGRNVLSEECR